MDGGERYDEPQEFADDGFADVHLWDYVQIVLQRLPMALIIFFLTVAMAAVYSWTRTPRFRASAKVMIERSAIDLTAVKGAYDQGAGGGQREFMQTQVRLITSRPTMEKVLDRADLFSDPTFLTSRDPVATLAGNLSVAPLRNTQIIEISCERQEARQAARIVNETIDAYIEENLKRRMGVSDDGMSELQKKAESLRVRLDESTRVLQAFMEENNIVSFEKAQNIVVERLRDMSSELTRAQPRRMELQAQIDAAEEAIKDGKPMHALPSVILSPVINNLKVQLSSRQEEYSRSLQRLGENHPQLKAQAIGIKSVEDRIASEANNILTAMRTQYAQARKAEQLLTDALKQHELTVFHFNKLTSEYDLLKQRKDSIENTYNTIIRRIAEIDMNRIGGQGNNTFVIERAAIPEIKSWPSKGKNMMVAIVLGLGLAIGCCFFMDYMDVTIKGESEVKQYLYSHVLSAVPDMLSEVDGDVENSELVAVDNSKSHFAESFRSLRTALAFSTHGKAVSSLVVSSTFPSEGKSLVSINLALAQAQAGRKTLLVDADMRKPRLHKTFDVSDEKGLSSLLSSGNEDKIDEYVYETGVENFSFMPCGIIPANPVEMIDSPRFDALVKEMESHYDMVIFDSPPSFSLVDSLVLGKRVAGMVLVVRSFVTPKQAGRQVADQLRDAGVPLLGVALNNVDQPKSGNTYGGAYYYGRYGKYHAKYYGDDKDSGAPKSLWARISGSFKSSTGSGKS